MKAPPRYRAGNCVPSSKAIWRGAQWAGNATRGSGYFPDVSVFLLSPPYSGDSIRAFFWGSQYVKGHPKLPPSRRMCISSAGSSALSSSV
jgi:hypothetical protein